MPQIEFMGAPIKVSLEHRPSWGDERVYGLWNYKDLSIKLDADVSDEVLHRVLLHELIHVVLDFAGREDHDEQLVDIVAHGFTALLADNPWLADTKKVSRKVRNGENPKTP